jgi:hypothetical protein
MRRWLFLYDYFFTYASYEHIKELVDKNIGESDKHDFKAGIPDSNTLTAICCACANTYGGFIIFGVSENNTKWTIKGMNNDKDIALKFGQKINADPTIQFNLPKIIPIPKSDMVLPVFYIPLSPERPHIPSASEKRIFWKRTNKGKDYMTYQEIRMSFQNYEERREKLKLLYLELISNSELLEIMKVDVMQTLNLESLVPLDSSIINSLLTDVYTIIGKNTELVRLLMVIRNEIRIINTKISFFSSQISIPRSNEHALILEHNQFLNQKIRLLVPLIGKACEILEKDFSLKRPI